MPFRHHLPLLSSQNPNHLPPGGTPQHQNPPSPTPIPLSTLIGTGSNNHTPHRAKSSASNGPVIYNHSSTVAPLRVLRSGRGQEWMSEMWAEKRRVKVDWAMTAKPWSVKKRKGPVKGCHE